MKCSRVQQFVFITALTLFFTYVYWRFQPQIIAGDGKGWDGLAYYQIFKYFEGLTYDSNVLYPFCKRVGLPFLAALMPTSSDKAFLYLNLTVGFLAIIFSYAAIGTRFTFSVRLDSQTFTLLQLTHQLCCFMRQVFSLWRTKNNF
jgi:hypothetical protein